MIPHRLAGVLGAFLLLSASPAVAQEAELPPPPSSPPAPPPPPAPQPETASPAPPPHDEAGPPRSGFYAAAETGVFGQRMLSVPALGWSAALSLGGDYPRAGVGGMWAIRVEYGRGTTAAGHGFNGGGVGTYAARMGGEGGWVLANRVRLGAGVHLGRVGFWRATTGELVEEYVTGLALFGAVDLVHVDHHALTLSLRGNLDTDVQDVTGSLGFRF